MLYACEVSTGCGVSTFWPRAAPHSRAIVIKAGLRQTAAPQGAAGARRPIVGYPVRSEQQLQVIGRTEVVDEVDGVGARLDRQAEQVARAAGVLVDGDHGHLRALWRGLHHVAVTAIDGEDVTVRRDGQAERALQRAALRHRDAGAAIAMPERGAGDGGD